MGYTGTGGASQTFTHNLGVAPELVIVKNRDSAAAWESLGTALSSSQRQIYLNRTQAGVAVASGHLGWNGTDGAWTIELHGCLFREDVIDLFSP